MFNHQLKFQFEVPNSYSLMMLKLCNIMAIVKKIENTEYSAMMSGVPLNQRYLFEQSNFYWAEKDIEGCEHTLEGKKGLNDFLH